MADFHGVYVSLPITPEELEKPDVLRGQRREWSVERTGWVVIGLILLGGLLGVFGGGPLAHASRSSGSVRLEFDRFVRHGVLTELRLTVGPEYVVDHRVRIALHGEFLQAMDIRDIEPAPLSSAGSSGELTFEFAAGTSENTIVFEIEPRQAGARRGQVEVAGTAAMEIRQFVFP